MTQPEQPHTILLVHCHYRLPGGEDAVFAAECAMLQAHGHRVITYERNNDAGGLAQKLLRPCGAIYSTKTVREVRALIRKEQVDLVHVHNTLLTISPSVFQACFKEHVPAVQTLHNFRIFCPNGILMRDGHVCEECPQHGLGCAVRAQLLPRQLCPKFGLCGHLCVPSPAWHLPQGEPDHPDGV